jgi:sortase A
MAKTLRLSSRKALTLGIALIGVGILAISPMFYSEVIETQVKGSQQQQQAAELSKVLDKATEVAPEKNKPFAVFYVPRFGPDFRRPIAEGTSVEKVLNTVGIGHYLGTAMPNQVGNFALASHRTTHGGAFNHIDQLVPGDLIYVEFSEGWTTYEVAESAVVAPNETWVIGPNPLNRAEDKWITLTTCTPRYTTEKRHIVWAKQVDFRTRQVGPPAALAAIID